MKRKGYLFEKVACFSTLRKSAVNASRGKHLSFEASRYMLDLESETIKLERELLDGAYKPQAYRHFFIYEQKPRMISAAPFRDRVVHHAVCAILEPIFESYAIFDSYACRKGKGTHQAMKRAQYFVSKGGYCLAIDVKKYFASINQMILKTLLRRKIKDRRMLALLDLIIDTGGSSVAQTGLPIGNLTSQQFANFYLGRLDHFVKENLRMCRYLRYMDDMFLFHPCKTELWEALQAIEMFLREELKLSLNTKRTRLVPVTDGVAFLGFRIWHKQIRLSAKSVRRFRDGVRRTTKCYQAGKIGEEALRQSMMSLLGHIQHANTYQFCRSFWARQLGEETK